MYGKYSAKSFATETVMPSEGCGSKTNIPHLLETLQFELKDQTHFTLQVALETCSAYCWQMSWPKDRQTSCHPDAKPIRKIDAAGRQLRAAIRLYFAEEDEVAIHVLACAAHEILRQIGKNNATPVIVLDANKAPFDESRRPEIRAILSDDYNFFKHAGRDATDTIYFNADISVYFLFDAARAYAALTSSMPDECAVLLSWVGIQHPDWVTTFDPIKIAALGAEFPKTKRSEYYKFAFLQIDAVKAKLRKCK